MLKVCEPSPPVPTMSTRCVLSATLHLGGELAHHLGGGGDLADGFLLHAQAGDQRRRHHGRQLAAHDQAHDLSISSWKISRCSMVRCSASWGVMGMASPRVLVGRDCRPGPAEAKGDEHGAGRAVQPVHAALHAAAARHPGRGQRPSRNSRGWLLTLNSAPSSTKASALLLGLGRDELRHEGQEEDRDLGIEHVGPEAAAEDALSAAPACRPRRRAIRSGLTWRRLGQQQLHARPTPGRPRPTHLSTVNAVAEVASSALTPKRRREDMHEAAGRDAQPGHHAGPRAASAARCVTMYSTSGPGVRFSSQPAAMNSSRCCASGMPALRPGRNARIAATARSTPAASTSRWVTKRRRYRPVASTPCARQVLPAAPADCSRAGPDQVDEQDVGLRRLDLQARRCRPGPRPAAAPARGPAPAGRRGGRARSDAAAASRPAWRIAPPAILRMRRARRDQFARAAQRRADGRAQALAEADRDAVEQ